MACIVLPHPALPQTSVGRPAGSPPPVFRGWINLKAALTSKDEHAILAECERGEDSAVAEYKKAMAATGLPADVAETLRTPSVLFNPDELRSTPEAGEFVRQFAATGKPIAAICHGPWVLIEAGLVKGRKLTSYPSIQTGVRNAGGTWVDEEVVVDRGIVTSRKPSDVPAVCAAIIEAVARVATSGNSAIAPLTPRHRSTPVSGAAR